MSGSLVFEDGLMHQPPAFAQSTDRAYVAASAAFTPCNLHAVLCGASLTGIVRVRA